MSSSWYQSSPDIYNRSAMNVNGFNSSNNIPTTLYQEDLNYHKDMFNVEQAQLQILSAQYNNNITQLQKAYYELAKLVNEYLLRTSDRSINLSNAPVIIPIKILIDREYSDYLSKCYEILYCLIVIIKTEIMSKEYSEVCMLSVEHVLAKFKNDIVSIDAPFYKYLLNVLDTKNNNILTDTFEHYIVELITRLIADFKSICDKTGTTNIKKPTEYGNYKVFELLERYDEQLSIDGKYMELIVDTVQKLMDAGYRLNRPE